MRQGDGVTLRNLSNYTGITPANLCRIEAGKSDPRLSTLEAILDALGYRLQVEKYATAPALMCDVSLSQYATKKRQER